MRFKYKALLLSLLCGYFLLAQNAPNEATMTQNLVQNTNLFNGSHNISLPLYTIGATHGSTSISLGYNTTGIQVDQEASWVGLGWSLNVGGTIVQQVRGLNDLNYRGDYSHLNLSADVLNGISYSSNNCDDKSCGDNFNKCIIGINNTGTNLAPQICLDQIFDKDWQPDLFYFSCGGFAGQFILDGSNVILLDRMPLKIELTRLGANSNAVWNITAPDGTIYEFTINNYFSDTENPDMAVTWYVSKIIPTGVLDRFSQEAMQFTYEQEDFKLPLYYETENMIRSANQTGDAYIYPTTKQGIQKHYVVNRFRPQRLKSISYKNMIVDFVASDRTDIENSAFAASEYPTFNCKKLDAIVISRSDGKIIREFDFSYDKFYDASFQTEDATKSQLPTNLKHNSNLSTRMFLSQIVEKNGTQSLKPYIFNYFFPIKKGLTTSRLQDYYVPSKGSFAKDKWGYFNGKGNTSLLESYTFSDANLGFSKAIGGGADRSPEEGEIFSTTSDYRYMRTFSLSDITYPSGMRTTYELEPNVYEYLNGTTKEYHAGGGLRIKEVRETTIESTSDVNANFVSTEHLVKRFIYLNGTQMSTPSQVFIHNPTTNTYMEPNSLNHITNVYQFYKDNENYQSDDQAGRDAKERLIKLMQFENQDMVISRCKTYTPGDYSPVAALLLFIDKIANQNDINLLKTSGAYLYVGCEDYTNPSGYVMLSSLYNVSPGAQGRFVGYGNVTEVFGPLSSDNTVSGNGKTEYVFECQQDYIHDATNAALDTDIGFLPNTPFTSYNFNGNLLKATFFATTDVAGVYKTIKMIENTYTNTSITDGYDDVLIVKYGVNIIPNFTDDQTTGFTLHVTGGDPIPILDNSGEFTCGSLHANIYEIQSRWNRLLKTVTTEYDTDGQGNAFQTEISYDYENADHMQITKVTSKINSDKNIVTRIRYPQDYVSITIPHNNTLDNNNVVKILMINSLIYNNIIVPIEKITYEEYSDPTKNLITTSNIDIYEGTYFYPIEQYILEIDKPMLYSEFQHSNVLITPTSGKAYSQSDPNYVRKANYTAYDTEFRVLLEASRENNIVSSQLWGYKGTAVLAKILNAKYQQVAFTSFEDGDNLGRWTISTNNITGISSDKAKTGNKSFLITSETLSADVVKKCATCSTKYTISCWATNQPVIANTILKKSEVLSGLEWGYYEFQTTSAIGDATISITASTGGNTYIDELRLHPVDARMQTSTFEPLIGVTSQTDIQSVTRVKYEYDDLARIRIIRDQDNNILNRYTYNLKSFKFLSILVDDPQPATFEEVEFTCQVDLNNVQSGFTYRWDFGDGTPIITTNNKTVAHTYITCGFFTVVCQVESKDISKVIIRKENYQVYQRAADQDGTTYDCTFLGDQINLTFVSSATDLAGTCIPVVAGTDYTRSAKIILSGSGNDDPNGNKPNTVYNWHIEVDNAALITQPTPTKCPSVLFQFPRLGRITKVSVTMVNPDFPAYHQRTVSQLEDIKINGCLAASIDVSQISSNPFEKHLSISSLNISTYPLGNISYEIEYGSTVSVGGGTKSTETINTPATSSITRDPIYSTVSNCMGTISVRVYTNDYQSCTVDLRKDFTVVANLNATFVVTGGTGTGTPPCKRPGSYTFSPGVNVDVNAVYNWSIHSANTGKTTNVEGHDALNGNLTPDYYSVTLDVSSPTQCYQEVFTTQSFYVYPSADPTYSPAMSEALSPSNGGFDNQLTLGLSDFYPGALSYTTYYYNSATTSYQSCNFNTACQWICNTVTNPIGWYSSPNPVAFRLYCHDIRTQSYMTMVSKGNASCYSHTTGIASLNNLTPQNNMDGIGLNLSATMATGGTSNDPYYSISLTTSVTPSISSFVPSFLILAYLTTDYTGVTTSPYSAVDSGVTFYQIGGSAVRQGTNSTSGFAGTTNPNAHYVVQMNNVCTGGLVNEKYSNVCPGNCP